MASYPSHGEQNWDAPLLAYLQGTYLPNSGTITFGGQLYRDDFNTAFGDSGGFVHLRRSITQANSSYQAVAETHVDGHGTRSVGSFYYGHQVQMSDDSSVATTVPVVTGAANNGSGLIRITCVGHGFTTGDWIAVYGVGGTTEANGTWAITVIDSNHFDLQGSTFTNAYTSGGKATNRPGMYGFFSIVVPKQSRDLLLTGTASDAEDLNGYGVYNGSSNNSKALTGYLVNQNSSFTGDQWWSGFQVEANVTYGYVQVGNVSQYGIDFNGGFFNSPIPTYGAGALRLPNNVPVMGRNAANSADVEVMRLDNTNAVKFVTTCTFTAVTNFNNTLTLNSALSFGDGVNAGLGTTNGTKIGTSASQKLGFYNATPVVQPNGTGNTHTVAAGATTSVFTNTTFDGSTGTTAYTVGDIVKALKSVGLLAA